MLRTSRALLLGVFIGILVMSLLPVSAADNLPSGDGVTPRVIPHFGGDDCDDPNVASAATHSFTVVTPSNRTFTDTNGVQFELAGINARSIFNWTLKTAGWVVYDVVVKGGTNSNHYDYQASTAGLQTADTGLHAPLKGQRYDNLSHITFCYDVPPLTISGTKYHDRDSDGDNLGDEEALSGFTIKAFNGTTEVASDVTDGAGNYELAVGVGTFTVCEVPPTLSGGFKWKQTNPSGSGAANCVPLGTNLAPAGHTVPVSTTSVSGIDFYNVRAVTLNCGQTFPFPSDTGEPDATIVVPEDCDSTNLEVVFDVGVDADEGYTQFVVFGGDPTGTAIFTQTIDWEPEPAVYDEFQNLIVPETTVVLVPGGDEQDVVPCGTQFPDADNPDCRYSRTVNEGGSVPAGMVQVSEVWHFFGDPTRAR